MATGEEISVRQRKQLGFVHSGFGGFSSSQWVSKGWQGSRYSHNYERSSHISQKSVNMSGRYSHISGKCDYL